MKNKQRIIKLEKILQKNKTSLPVPIMALIKAKTEEELQGYIRILKERPSSERPMGYEKCLSA